MSAPSSTVSPRAATAAQGSVGASPWLERRPRSSSAPPKLRLVCFPYAGGGAGVFRAWHGAFGPDVETVVLRAPGRESRLAEPALTRMEPLADAASRAIEALADRPLVLFGHSLGSLVALEVAHRLWAAGQAPAALLVSGRRAPHLPAAQPKLHDRPEAELLAELRRMGGTPEELLADKALMEMLLPMIRADFEVFETYEPTPDRAPLPCPVVAYGGVRDADVGREHLEAWRAYGNGEFDLHMFPGGHFFLQEGDARSLRATVARALAKLK